jgi:hypothetical protein
MKTVKSLCLSALVLAGATVGAGGQSFRTDINPALLYQQAFLVAPTPMAEADMDYLYSKEGLSQKLPDRFDRSFAGYDDEFRLLRQARQATVPCDWGIDLSAGPGTLLPHLARAKAAAQAARFRVMWELQHGRQTEACEDLLASFALARNISRDGTFIATLCQSANEAINCATLAQNFGQFTPETLKELEAGLDAGPARATVVACLGTERFLGQGWLRAKILELQKASPGDDARVMEGIRELLLGFNEEEPLRVSAQMSIETNVWQCLSQAAGGTSAGVLKLLQAQDPVWEKLAEILALPYPQSDGQVKQFLAENRTTPDPRFPLSFPDWEKALKRDLRMRVWLAMVRAAIEYKLQGEPGLRSVSDPAGQGPFAFQRFVFQGVDRGFALKSAYTGSGFQETLIFVEKEGPPFRVDGPFVGQARQ